MENLEINAQNQATSLTELEIRILDFEGQWWKFAGAKESAIKELFDMTPPAYYQLLNNLIDRDDALLAAPMLVKRLGGLREPRTNARSLYPRVLGPPTETSKTIRGAPPLVPQQTVTHRRGGPKLLLPICPTLRPCSRFGVSTRKVRVIIVKG
jgi:hypothetical protein